MLDVVDEGGKLFLIGRGEAAFELLGVESRIGPGDGDDGDVDAGEDIDRGAEDDDRGGNENEDRQNDEGVRDG